MASAFAAPVAEVYANDKDGSRALLVGVQGDTLRACDIKSGECNLTWKAEAAITSPLVLHGDGKSGRLWFGDQQGTVYVLPCGGPTAAFAAKPVLHLTGAIREITLRRDDYGLFLQDAPRKRLRADCCEFVPCGWGPKRCFPVAPRSRRGILDPMASVPGKKRPDMPGRVRQATLVFLGPDDPWRKWCARALAVNRLHGLVCPQRPKEAGKPGAAPARPSPRVPPEADPWPYPLMTVAADRARQRLLAMEAVAVVVHEDDDLAALGALLDLLVGTLGASRVALAVICEKRDSPWLNEEALRRFPVTITVLSRRGDCLTLLRRARRATDDKRRPRSPG